MWGYPVLYFLSLKCVFLNDFFVKMVFLLVVFVHFLFPMSFMLLISLAAVGMRPSFHVVFNGFLAPNKKRKGGKTTRKPRTPRQNRNKKQKNKSQTKAVLEVLRSPKTNKLPKLIKATNEIIP